VTESPAVHSSHAAAGSATLIKVVIKVVVYGQAKTANVLFAVGLEARGAKKGIHAFAVHPGGIVTDLMRHLSIEEKEGFGVVDGKATAAEVQSPTMAAPMRFKTVPQGAATQVWAATSEMLEGKGGVYCEDCDVAKIAEEAGASGVRPYAIDPALAERLWTRSEEWTGVAFEI
jgi:NAD(P)-dependent dehydrogenase (short-subunit alcohol dehydrogenase family)